MAGRARVRLPPLATHFFRRVTALSRLRLLLPTCGIYTTSEQFNLRPVVTERAGQQARGVSMTPLYLTREKRRNLALSGGLLYGGTARRWGSKQVRNGLTAAEIFHKFLSLSFVLTLE